MLRLVDNVLNRVTMYRLTAYVFLALIAAAMIFGWLGMIPYEPPMILFSVLYITAVCMLTNAVFGWAFRAPVNVESVYITALILALIISPPSAVNDGAFLELAGWASVWGIASKFVLAIRRKHIFNPAAFGVAMTALFLGASASWWVATLPLMPFVLVGGLLLIRKIQRFDLMLSFFLVAIVAIIAPRFSPDTLVLNLWRVAVNVPLFFFAFAMLSEPLTTPPTRLRRILYGAFTGLAFAPWVHIGPFYGTPELALLAGNVVSYALSPKTKLMLTLKKKIRLAKDTYDFHFATDRPLAFAPGQYLEWTLPHAKPDSRGNRRYFTMSSSPTERGITMGVRFSKKGSSFKKRLLGMRAGDTMAAGQLSGDFVMPRNTDTKLAFIAGGIGVTPFRSMIRASIDRGEKRPITLFYSNRIPEDIAYADVFEAARDYGIKTVYTLTDEASAPEGWPWYTGHLNADVIREEMPDYLERRFYLSGPRSMIDGFKRLLSRMGVPARHIETDFFPGFA